MNIIELAKEAGFQTLLNKQVVVGEDGMLEDLTVRLTKFAELLQASEQGWTSYWEDEEKKDTLIVEQYTPNHIVIVLPNDESFVQVMRNENGSISSKVYKAQASEPVAWRQTIYESSPMLGTEFIRYGYSDFQIMTGDTPLYTSPPNTQAKIAELDKRLSKELEHNLFASGKIAQLEAKLDKAREALQFYANKKHMTLNGSENGSIARNILKEIE